MSPYRSLPLQVCTTATMECKLREVASMIDLWERVYYQAPWQLCMAFLTSSTKVLLVFQRVINKDM